MFPKPQKSAEPAKAAGYRVLTDASLAAFSGGSFEVR
jgi:hypothetical protein